jgi:serine/threonine-protein kinase
MPDNADWLAVKEAVANALELPVDARQAFLDQTCADATLRAEVEKLLRSCASAVTAETFLDQPAAQFAACIIAEVEQQEPDALAALQTELAGRYTIDRELGRGGMATVHLARDERHGRFVALKVVHTTQRPLRSSAHRFEREIEIAARLTHPHILPLHDSGSAAGVLYYVMPYVEGETLRDYLARTGPAPLDVAIRVLADVTRALAHAHRHGVVHRDIKPGNILLNQDGDALVSDFGVATALVAVSADDSTHADVSTTLVFGTPAYMAPEQASGTAAVDPRADLYALGVIAYEMLTGATPFGERSTPGMLAAHRSEQPEPVTARRADTPPMLAALIMRLLSKRPEDRPQNANEVLRTLEAAATPGARSPLERRVFLGAGALVLLSVLGVLAFLSNRASPPVERSIAVLAFANSSGRVDDEQFSDGLTDELIRALGRVPGLRVAARTSTFELKGKGLSTRRIADTLGVNTVLQGAILHDGDRLTVSARLVDPRDSRILWSETYERAFRDMFDVQEQIARDIVSALSVRLTRSGLPEQLVERGTENLQAYESYLKGRFLFNIRERDGLFRAVQYFEDAIKADSQYARAYAGVADVYNLLGIFGFERPHDAFPKARAAAERAIQLDSLLVEPLAALAHQLFVYEWDWQAAERAFMQAIALDPRYPPVRLYYAAYLHVTGRHEEALAELREARMLDPLTPTGMLMGRIYVNTGQPDLAIPELNEALALNPRLDLAHQQLSHAYLLKGDHQEAIASMQRAAALSGGRDSAQLAYVYAVAGRRAEAESIVRRLVGVTTYRELLPFHIAMAYSGLGDIDEAFRWLDAAYERHASFMDGIAVAAGLSALRSDPRFAALLRKMGLSAYTR